ncbi:ATP-dependent RNA helicase laf-1-like [Pectinophora gossypiella]|uniref:ATP-dependent RNA helicase laf-1-like n=1 Tax=Pectinophora gossypiella TaxID=13191 RepID=UPI00214E938C|nr:ATP-dependent RNA helicase laf-1-like [Pectinophora gossypiella]
MVVAVNMARVIWCVVLLVLVACGDCGVHVKRVRRGYNSGYGDSSSGYGRGSDERDASVSEESGGCSSGGGYGRGYNSNGGRELAYNRDGRPTSDTRGGRSFIKSTASAAASASSYTLNQKNAV